MLTIGNLPSGIYKARTGRTVERVGPRQEIIPLPGIHFFDGWRVHPSLTIPTNLPQTQDALPIKGTPRARTETSQDVPRPPEEEARDILAAAYKNQAENGLCTRRAAIRACKYLKTLVDRYGSIINEVHMAARVHTQHSKGATSSNTQYHPTGQSLPKISPELTSELLHFFFRPSPSRLSPGRNTVFVPVERIVQHLAMFPLWGVQREQDPYKVQTSPCVTAIPENKRFKPKRGASKSTQQNQTTKRKQNPQKNTIIRTYALVNAATCAPMN